MEQEMKSTMVEGVPDRKIKRLQGHLLKAERLAKQPLSKSPRADFECCPILNFAPLHNSEGRQCEFDDGNDEYDGHAIYFYPLYSFKDSIWWQGLPPKTCRAITKYISNWIKERNREKKAD
jgi:hypothetical protein